MTDINQQLQQVYEAIKAGRKQEAISILRPILEADPDQANAWWLMANAQQDPQAIREALENVLRLRPDNDKAQQMLAKLDARYPRKPKPPADEFDFDVQDDPFGGEEYVPRQRPAASAAPGQVKVVKSSGGSNTTLIILAVVGVIAVVACGACFALPALGITLFSQQVGQIVNDPTVQAAIQEMADSVTMIAAQNAANTTLGDYVSRGTVQRGQTLQGNVDTINDDGWVYNADGGEQLTIEVLARGDLDPQLYIFRPDGTLLAQNDDINFMDDTNSRVQVTLPTSGPYVIVVSAFGPGGEYDLTVR